MKYSTENELNHQSKYFAFKLRKLYLNDQEEFYRFQEYFNLPLYINERGSLKYHFFSDVAFSKGEEIDKLYEYGPSYLQKVSDTRLLDIAITKIKHFEAVNDYDSVCNCLQALRLNKKMTPYFSNKILINEQLTLNTTHFPTDSIFAQKVFQELIPYGLETFNKWMRYQMLTKREKEILKLIAEGYSNCEMSQKLYITEHSVKTHRKKIYKKLDINRTSELVRLSIAMELIF